MFPPLPLLRERQTYRAASALALGAASEVVDDDIGASATEEQSVCLSQSTTGAGDDDRLAVPS